MTLLRRLGLAGLLFAFLTVCASYGQAAGPPVKAEPPADPNLLPLTKLAPSKIVPNLCAVRYRISTTSPECQAHFDQGLGYFYSYVWMEAARSFETALKYDPDCPMAWWGLHRALTQWGKKDLATKALLKADELKSRANEREKMLILARMQETGNAPGVGDADARKKAATTTIDNLLATYDDDEEGWYYRAQLSGGAGGFGGTVGAVPFYKALLKINPLHPGANHELVHFYENYKRPALGWYYAEKYIESSPGLPHAFHMQAHLGTRIGRWDKTSDYSARAIELQRQYHKDFNVKPREDHQYSHHLETLLLSLTHDGRFKEGEAIKKEMDANNYKSFLPWFRLYLAARQYDEALKIVEQQRRGDKTTASYMAALVYLKRGDTERAKSEVEVLQNAFRSQKNNKQLQSRLWEAQGQLMCQTGDATEGLKLLERAVKDTKDDYRHHAWGNGAYFMELWGIAALQAGKDDIAEEAFLEALAHDSGSVRGALGLQVLCERHNRTEEAARYAELAKKFWKRADAGRLEAELSAMRESKAALDAPR